MASKRGVPPRKTLSRENLILRGVPPEYIEATIESYKRVNNKKQLFEDYLDNLHLMYEDRICLMMYGKNGVGKSYLASIIVKEGYRLRYSTEMITVQGLMNLHFNQDKSIEELERINRIKNAEFLVIDEVGKENFTRTGSNIILLEETLRNSISKGQVVIMCTNLPLKGEGGLYELYGKSIESLVGGDYVKLKFTGEDYRPNVMRNKEGTKILRGEVEYAGE